MSSSGTSQQAGDRSGRSGTPNPSSASSSAGGTAAEALRAAGILSDRVVAAEVDGAVVDLHTPLSLDGAEVKPIEASDSRALPIIRHSTAHVMADAVQRLFPGTRVAFGPAIETGFYYDYDRPDGKFSEEDLRAIEKEMAAIIEQDTEFVREVVAPDVAKSMLAEMEESYKLEHLERLTAAGEEISIYRHGKWVDLCEGPHVPSTRFLKAFQLTHVAGAYWRGDERNPMLQRIYGTAFATPKALRAHLKQLEEAKKRDHRKLGKELGLFAFHPLAPASPFFLPRGAHIYNALADYIRALYRRDGYREVVTPQVFDNDLFRTSGHLPSYGENMYFAATPDDFSALNKKRMAGGEAGPDDIRFGVKPMNCPGHAVMFGMERHSYRELPIRIADFGRLHRYERSGVVQGLTRVRTFAQDDAHIFCTPAQVQGEITSFLQLVFDVYKDFGFQDVRVVVATRPDERIGSDEVWDRAEQALITAVDDFGQGYTVAEGEGAFYGPKVEFHLKDALGRGWQLGTIQADFNLPERFKLEYVGEDNQTHQPVMLHRAILGSIERFFGILVEHVAGAFPTWLAPEQVMLLPVSEKLNDYAEEIRVAWTRLGIRVEVDGSSEKLGAKVRRARLLRVPYRAVVGQKEQESRSLSVTRRDGNEDLGALPLDQVADMILKESLPPSLSHQAPGPLETPGSTR